MSNKKIMVCGSRTINDEKLIFSKLDDVLINYPNMVLISGNAKGVDSISEKWAKSHDIQIELYKPDWQKYGRAAGIIRNKLMVENSDFVVVFWDGISKGTKSDIDFCKKLNKPFFISEMLRILHPKKTLMVEYQE